MGPQLYMKYLRVLIPYPILQGALDGDHVTVPVCQCSVILLHVTWAGLPFRRIADK